MSVSYPPTAASSANSASAVPELIAVAHFRPVTPSAGVDEFLLSSIVAGSSVRRAELEPLIRSKARPLAQLLVGSVERGVGLGEAVVVTFAANCTSLPHASQPVHAAQLQPSWCVALPS